MLGSAWREPRLGELTLQARPVATPWGVVQLHHLPDRDDAWVLFRHGLPHRHLPHQIPWRAHAHALARVGVGALLITSSVGVLDPDLPLATPLLLSDLLWPDNRLPDGTACTIFVQPEPGQGHLVLDDGIFSTALSQQIAELPPLVDQEPARVIFAYVAGPRTKTAAENRWWAAQGAQVNSMSVGPEAVLANELGMPVAGLVIGHKYSVPDRRHVADHGLSRRGIDESLHDARRALEAVVLSFLRRGRPVPFANRLHTL